MQQTMEIGEVEDIMMGKTTVCAQQNLAMEQCEDYQTWWDLKSYAVVRYL